LIHTPDFPLWDGGIAAVGYEYARALTLAGHHVVVVTQEQTPEDRAWDQRQPFRVLRLKKRKAFWLQYLDGLRVTRSLVRSTRFDFTMSLRWNVSGLICHDLSQRHNIPHLQWFNGNEIYDRHRKGIWARLLLRSIQEAKVNVSISRFAENALQATVPFGFRSVVVYLGVNCEQFSPVADTQRIELRKELGVEGSIVLLSLGRLVERKGQDLVIAALPELVKRYPNLLYVIVGRGRDRDRLMGLVERHGVGKFVRFDGFVPDDRKAAYYRACDIYLMPSREIPERGDVEGFGLTFLEANACGKPVIGGRSGGCVEAIEHGVNGLLVDPASSREVADAIASLLDNPDGYRRMSERAVEHVRARFSWEASAQRVVQLAVEEAPSR
jgi:phosphatidylinositol alpha-1,6-mannosyltransferase